MEIFGTGLEYGWALLVWDWDGNAAFKDLDDDDGDFGNGDLEWRWDLRRWDWGLWE